MLETHFAPGSHLANGRYRIDRVLGEGGMGTVYEATELALERKVALKVLLPELSQHPTARQRMEAEAKAMARLNSQHVVRVNTVFDEGGLLVIDLEYMSGGSLAHKLEAGPVDAAMASRWIVQILKGLEELHEVGLVHRDLKPANVMIDHRGMLKVTDLGIAHDSQRTTGFKTRHDANLGTPEYMAPEQIQSAATVDARADVYAAGVMLYEFLTGRVPFAGGEFEVKSGHVRDAVDLGPVRETSEELVGVVQRALQKATHDRYESARQMRKAVLTALPEDKAEMTVRPRVPVMAPVVAPVQAHAVAAKATVPTWVSPKEISHSKTAVASVAPPHKTFPIVPVLAAAALLVGLVVFAVSRNSESARAVDEVLAPEVAPTPAAAEASAPPPAPEAGPAPWAVSAPAAAADPAAPRRARPAAPAPEAAPAAPAPEAPWPEAAPAPEAAWAPAPEAAPAAPEAPAWTPEPAPAPAAPHAPEAAPAPVGWE